MPYLTLPGDDFTRCGTCGHWTITNQPHACHTDPGEHCDAIDIDNCAEHGQATRAHRNNEGDA